MIRTQPSPPADVASLLRDLGRGAQPQQDLGTDGAHALFASMLEGAVPQLELGAILLAYRFKGETIAELAGFIAAVDSWTRQIARRTIPPDRVADIQRRTPAAQSDGAPCLAAQAL